MYCTLSLSLSTRFPSRNTPSKSPSSLIWAIRVPHFPILTLTALFLLTGLFTHLTYAQLIESDKESPRVKTTDFSLAERYHTDIDLTQYWVSEKLDGVRALWNGNHFISRGGNIFRAPNWFTANFPKKPLDGELWIRRGGFQKTVSAVRKQNPVDEEWQRVTYQVFDLPDSPEPFNARLLQLEQISSRYSGASNNKKYLQLIPQQRVTNHRQLSLLLIKLVAEGAEGLMLHHQDSYYRAGRSNDLLKYKPRYDAEAVVLGYRSGKGKYAGATGSLLVELASGIRFHIGSGLTDKERISPPPIGSVISFRYWGLTKKGIPRHASFLRLRSDADL